MDGGLRQSEAPWREFQAWLLNEMSFTGESTMHRRISEILTPFRNHRDLCNYLHFCRSASTLPIVISCHFVSGARFKIYVQYVLNAIVSIH